MVLCHPPCIPGDLDTQQQPKTPFHAHTFVHLSYVNATTLRNPKVPVGLPIA